MGFRKIVEKTREIIREIMGKCPKCGSLNHTVISKHGRPLIGPGPGVIIHECGDCENTWAEHHYD